MAPAGPAAGSPGRAATGPLLRLCAPGLLLVGTVSFFAFVYPQTPGRLEKRSASLIDRLAFWRALASWLPAPASPGSVGVAIALATVLSFLAYGIAILLVWGRTVSGRLLVCVGVVSLLLLLVSALALPNVNTDIYSYIAAGRVAAVHGADPYDHPPSAFPGDPIYPYVSEQYAGNLPSKLPAWMLVSVSLAWLGHDQPVTDLLLYRFVLLAFAVASLALVALTLRRVAPRYAAAGTIAFGWNPVTVVYGPSKTDTVMVFFLALSAFLLAASRRLPAVVSLTLSVLVKLITLPLLALYLLRDVRLRSWRQLGLALLVVASTATAVYLPFARGPGLLAHHLTLLTAAASSEGVNRSGITLAEGLARGVLVAGLVVLVAWQAARQDGSTRRLLVGWAVAALYLAVFLTTPTLAWYQLAPLAALALAPSAPIVLVAFAVTFGSFSLSIWSSASSVAFPLGSVYGLPRPAVFAAPIAAALVAAAATKTRRKAPAVAAARPRPSADRRPRHL